MSALSTGVFGESREVFLNLITGVVSNNISNNLHVSISLCNLVTAFSEWEGFLRYSLRLTNPFKIPPITAKLQIDYEDNNPTNGERVIANCRWGNNRMFIQRPKRFVTSKPPAPKLPPETRRCMAFALIESSSLRNFVMCYTYSPDTDYENDRTAGKSGVALQGSKRCGVDPGPPAPTRRTEQGGGSLERDAQNVKRSEISVINRGW